MSSFALCVLLALLTSCSTVLDGSDRAVMFRSAPSGAEVYLDGERIGTTPFLGHVEPTSEGEVVFRMAGHEDVSKPMPSWTANSFWGNFVAAGPVGMLVDWMTGAYVERPNSWWAVMPPVE